LTQKSPKAHNTHLEILMPSVNRFTFSIAKLSALPRREKFIEKAREKNKIVSILEPIVDEIKGAFHQSYLFSLEKI
jgi:hypothetical protein